ncbi:ANTAR domain-containing protein [Actinomycetospora atypica]|uniref:ANTAR domain-containing protein n=1 Tax=Actinomycetospora atypica TaxID=1290095 RepID=A0ABV9YH11_9PSEU
MEPDDLPGVLADRVTVHRAEGVLATMFDVSIAQAHRDLELRAQLADGSLASAAQQVLDDHARRIAVPAPPEVDERVLAVLRRHLNA